VFLLRPSPASCTFGKAAEGLSPHTLVGYEHDLQLWIKYAGDVDVRQVTTQDLRVFLARLHTDYKPHRFYGSEHPLAARTVHNVWITSLYPTLCRLSSPGRPPNSRCPIQ